MVRRYVRKRTFRTADRVLVQLSTEGLRPDERTQDGIAAATRSGRSTLTKWLNRLEGRGLVTRERIRFPGRPLPKWGYRLTEPGWHAATLLRHELAVRVVTVRTPPTRALPVRIAEIPKLASARLDLTGVVASVREGRLDLTGSAAGGPRSGPPVWGVGLRRVERLFGRTQELADLDAWWASERRALLLTGAAGIGKSALIATWVQGPTPDVPVFGFEARRSSTAAAFLQDLASYLASLGKPGLAAQLAQGVSLDVGFMMRLLRRDLPDRRILVVVDNADQVARDLARLLEALFLGTDGAARARTVFVGRRVPPWMEPEIRRRSLIEVRPIRGLDTASSRTLLRARGLPPDAAVTDQIIREARGHPLLLHLAAATGTGPGSEVRQYLDEVWGSLTPRDRATLEAASVFRKAVSERILQAVAGADPRRLESLCQRSLLERNVAGGYEMHDLVREFVQSRLPDPRRRAIHGRAAGAFLRGVDQGDRWRSVYHLLEAGRATEAADLLDAEGTRLLDSVAAEEVASLLRGQILDETESRTYCAFAETLADGLRIRGHVGPALAQYGHALRVSESGGDSRRTPRLLRKMAFVERCRNRYAKALGYLVEARGRLADAQDSEEAIEVLREMALAEQATGDLDAAARHLSEAIDLATERADPSALSRTLVALGSLEARQGHPDRGLETSLEGLRVAERAGNLTELARAHIVVGTALAEMGRFQEGIGHYDEGGKIAQLLGNLRLLAYATLNRSAALIEVGAYPEAGPLIREAEGYFTTLEERDTLALLKTYEGQRQMGLGQWGRARKAWEEGLEELRAHGSPADLALALKQVGDFYVRHGDVEAGRTHLLEARALSKTTGNVTLQREAETLLVRLGNSSSGMESV